LIVTVYVPAVFAENVAFAFPEPPAVRVMDG
jgi:hypothetical protein